MNYQANKYMNEESYVIVERVEIDGILHWVNAETGELMQPVKFFKSELLESDEPLAVDYTNVTSLTQLKRVCRYSQADSNTKLKPIFTPKHADLIYHGLITAKNYETFIKLAMKIQYRNVLVTTKDDLAKLLNTDAKNLSREVNKLTGLVEVLSPKGQKHATRVLVFNPEMVWKGDIRVQEMVLRRLHAQRMAADLEKHGKEIITPKGADLPRYTLFERVVLMNQPYIDMNAIHDVDDWSFES